MESVTKVLNESMLLWALFNVRLKLAELVLGHAYQLPQRLAFIEQGERIGDQVHLPAC